MSKKRTSYIYLFAAIAILVICLVSLFNFLAQNTRMKEIEAEKIKLEETLKEKQLEEKRLELLKQYRGTEEYIRQYAKFKLGYIDKNEVILDED